MSRWITVLLAVVVSAPLSAQSDPFARLQFLVGEWVAVETPAGESGSFTFKPDVQGHVMVRTNEANYAATADRAASRHEDLLVIYSENGRPRDQR